MILEWNQNNNTSSHMFLDHCYALGLLLWPSGQKKKLFEEGDPRWPILASPWFHPWAEFAEKLKHRLGAMNTSSLPAMITSSLPSFVNIHQVVL